MANGDLCGNCGCPTPIVTNVPGVQGAAGDAVGQFSTIKSLAGIGYSLTNATAVVTGMTLTVVATGTYLVMSRTTVDYSGATFAASRILTLKVRNTTTLTDLSTTARNTEVQSAVKLPSLDYQTPFVTVSLTIGDVIALQADISVVPSAGTAMISAASLCILSISTP